MIELCSFIVRIICEVILDLAIISYSSIDFSKTIIFKEIHFDI